MSGISPKTFEPKISQISVFLENRVGILMKLVKALEDRNVHLRGLPVVDTADYAYSLITRSNGQLVLVLHVDSHDTAVRILESHKLTVVGQNDIVWEGLDS